MDKPAVLSLPEVREIAVDAERFGRQIGPSWVLRLCATVEHYANHPRMMDHKSNGSENPDAVRARLWHLARVAKVEAAIAHEAEELRLLREWEAERIAAGEVSALPAWQALRAFRERGR